MSLASQSIEITTHDGLKLSGVLTSPEVVRGCVLLLSGSGAVGSHGDVSSLFVGSGYQGQPARLNEQLSFALAQEGFATLRFEKRGFADPTQVPSQTLPSLLSDAKRALQALIDAFSHTPVFLIGFSEGALLATLLASEEEARAGEIAGVFVLSPPTRPYPEALQYQFVEWPLSLIKTLDRENSGSISQEDLLHSDIIRLPLGELDGPLAQFGITLQSVESHQLPYGSDGKISIEDLKKIYQERLEKVSVLLQAPFMKALYESYLALPGFEKIAERVTAPVFAHIAMKDSQIPVDGMIQDVKAFSNLMSTSTYQNLGHAFAPMEGVLGQIKTSGPFSDELIQGIIDQLDNLVS